MSELNSLLKRHRHLTRKELTNLVGKATSPMIEQARQTFEQSKPDFNPWGLHVGGNMSLTHTCKMGPDNKCPMSSLVRDDPTLVFPGGPTRCIYGEPFAFQVWPGDRDKLVIFFEGGGACWDQVTTQVTSACKADCPPHELNGWFNTCSPGNPFSKHTIVFVRACSGDLHAGNVTRPWPNKLNNGKGIVQTGYYNTRAAVDWAKANMDPKLSTLMLGGESAGAIATQVWASTLLKELKYDQAYVLADSYVGVFPKKFQGLIFQELGVCDTGLIQGHLMEKCEDGSIEIADAFDAAMKEFPHVRFASLNSKHDAGQITFHNVATTTQMLKMMVAYCGSTDTSECDTADAPPELLEPAPPLEGPEFHRRMDETVTRLNSNPNYVAYIMSNAMHSISNVAWGDCRWIDYSKIGIAGFMGGYNGTQRLALRKWLQNFFFSKEPVQGFCEQLDAEDDDDTCAPGIHGKQLQA